jgi:glycosyltransferase involved in cell wall biosynthesis
LRILYLTEFLSAVGGGGEIIFRNLAAEIANRGHKVHIVCHQSDNFWSGQNDLMKVHRISPAIILRHGYFPSIFQQIPYILNLIIEGAKLIKHNKIEIIHANTLTPAIAGSILGKICDIPTITTVHHMNNLIKFEYAIRRGYLIQFYLSNLPKLLLDKMIVHLPVKIIHAVSNSTKEDLIRFGIRTTKIAVIPNGIDVRKQYLVKSEYEDLIVFIGRLVWYKNLEVIITAFQKVIKIIPSAKLVVIGDGPMKQKWEDMAFGLSIAHNTEFIGYVSEERKIDVLRKSSMLVFPSIIEGFGIVILEAFAQEKPVLVSDTKVLKEIVDDKVNGFVISPLDTNEWAEKITFLLKNKSTCKKMGSDGSHKVQRLYQAKLLAEKFELLYERLVAGQIDKGQ